MSQDVLPSTPLAPSSSSSGQAPLVVGLDLGGTKMAAALVDSGGTLQGPVSSCPTPAHEGPTAMLNAISGLIATVVETGTHQEPGRAAAITAVGIGTAGVVDVERGTILSATDAITGWAGTQVAAGVRERLAAQGLGELPIHVENDVDAYAAGEAWLGAGTGAEVVLMVAVGTGVGGALVLDGRTRRGAHHVAGEIAHVPVPGAQGEPCTCGRTGHLEGITAGPQIHRRYLAKGGDPDVPDARGVEERAAAGDDIAAEVYRDSATCLGRALAGLVTVIDPDVVVVSGGLARAGDLWWEPLRQTFAAEIIDPLAPIKILPATLGTTAPIAAVGIGTAGVVDVERGTILASTDAITGWAGTQVAAGVQERLAAQGLGEPPIHVENDVDAYAAGEAWLGAGSGAEVVLMVAVGTGVGGALVLEGRTRRGAHHVAGEIAHVPVPGAQGEPCTCGRTGHLEGITAGPQIHRRYLAKGGDADVPDARGVEERAAAGDGIAAEVYRDSAVCLGKALAGLVTVIDPDVVVVSGGLARAGDLWWEPLRQSFAAEIIAPLAPIKILPATLGTTAPIVGAARGALALASSNDNHRP